MWVLEKNLKQIFLKITKYCARHSLVVKKSENFYFTKLIIRKKKKKTISSC